MARILAYRQATPEQWIFEEIIIAEKHIIEKFSLDLNVSQTKQLNEYYFGLVTNIGLIRAPAGEMDRIILENKVWIFSHCKAMVMLEDITFHAMVLMSPGHKMIRKQSYGERLELKSGTVIRPDYYIALD